MPDWNDTTERQLLCGVLDFKSIFVSRKEWDELAAKMDLGFTGNACRYGD
jgi:hypothetical protein